MKRALIASIILSFLAVAVPRLSAAAVLSPATATPTASVGSALTVDLRLDSQGEVINAVEAVLRYDPDRLLLLDLSRGGSFLTLWAEEPRLVRPGEIALAGGIPDGSFVVGGKIVSLTFKVLRAGDTAVNVEVGRSGVYLHDGFGTPAPLTTTPLVLTPKETDVFAPQLTSTSHPIASQWSSNATFLVSWLVQPSTVVSYLLSRDPFAEPDDVVEENAGFTSFPNLTDGTWYFTLRQRLAGESWGPLARREVRVDASPPEPFQVDVIGEAGGAQVVSFSTTDRTSGMSHYIVRMERVSFWTPWRSIVTEQRTTGVASFTDFTSVRKISVIAFDLAGNQRIATWTPSQFREGTRVLLLLYLVGLLMLSLTLLLIVSHRGTGKDRRAGQ